MSLEEFDGMQIRSSPLYSAHLMFLEQLCLLMNRIQGSNVRNRVGTSRRFCMVCSSFGITGGTTAVLGFTLPNLDFVFNAEIT